MRVVRLLAALLVVTAVLAGCSTPPPVQPEPTPMPTVSPAALAAHVVDAKGGQGEPSLGVSATGVLFTNGVGKPAPGAGAVTNLGVGTVYRSTDNGTTWTEVDPGFQTPNLDGDLAVDVDGTVWVDNLWVGCTSVASSRDQGATWLMTPLGCNAPGDDRQYIIPTTGGTAYLFSHQLPTFYQTASKTTDYGLTWVPTGPMETPDHHLLVNSGSSWAGGGFWNQKTGSVFATWSRLPAAGTGFLPAYAVTHDGLTWTEGTAAKDSTGSPLGLSLVDGAADKAGNIYLTWGSISGKDVAIYVAGSKDDGKTWTDPVRIDVPGMSKVFPMVTAQDDGAVAVAWYEATEDGYPYEASKTAQWNVTVAWTTDFFGAGLAGAWDHLQLNSVSVHTGPVCPDGSGCSDNRELLDYFAVKALPDGRVGSVWTSTNDVKGKTVNVYGQTDLPVLRMPKAAATWPEASASPSASATSPAAR